MIKAKGKEYDKLQCPYVSSHIIDRCRFQLHLNRCRRAYKDIPLVQCPFNTTHMLNEPELDWHVTVCESRALFENYKYTVGTSSATLPKPVTKMPENQPSEDWDAEPDVPAYDPRTYAESSAVLRLMQNAPPSERKSFREAEEIRLKAMEGA